MTTQTPTATISPLNRTLAATMMALIVVQFAFVTVGGAEVSDTDNDSGRAMAITIAATPEDVGPAVAPTPSLNGATVDRNEETASNADVQWPPWGGIRMYFHPFIPDECFWFCMDWTCPCLLIFPGP